MERTIRLFFSVTLFICLLLALHDYAEAQSSKTASASPKVITWTFASSSGAGANIWAFSPYPRFQEMVLKATHGRLRLDVKVDLFPAAETLNGVISGRAEIGFQRIPYVSGTFPLWDFASLPFFFENVYEYEKAINDPRMTKIMDKTYADVGLVKLFEAQSTSVDVIFSNKMIKTIDDFKGLKIRTAGLLPTYSLKLLGANPLTMPVVEISEALQRGTVDAVLAGPGFGLGLGMADVTKFANYWAIQSAFGGTVAVNAKAWNALPADLQSILRNLAKEMQAQITFGSDVEYRVGVKGIEVAKMKVVMPEKTQIDKARELVKPAVDEWLKVAGAHGPEVLAIASEYASGAKIMVPKSSKHSK